MRTALALCYWPPILLALPIRDRQGHRALRGKSAHRPSCPRHRPVWRKGTSGETSRHQSAKDVLVRVRTAPLAAPARCPGRDRIKVDVTPASSALAGEARVSRDVTFTTCAARSRQGAGKARIPRRTRAPLETPARDSSTSSATSTRWPRTPSSWSPYSLPGERLIRLKGLLRAATARAWHPTLGAKT